MLAHCFLTVTPPTLQGGDAGAMERMNVLCGVINRFPRISNTACGWRSFVGCRSDLIVGRRRVPKYARVVSVPLLSQVRTSSSTRLRWYSTTLLSLRASSMRQKSNTSPPVPTPRVPLHYQCTFLLPFTGSFWHMIE